MQHRSPPCRASRALERAHELMHTDFMAPPVISIIAKAPPKVVGLLEPPSAFLVRRTRSYVMLPVRVCATWTPRVHAAARMEHRRVTPLSTLLTPMRRHWSAL